jgi:hypothetical protein
VQESREQQGKKWTSGIANALKGPELLPEDEIYELLATHEYDIAPRQGVRPNLILCNQ